MYTEDYRVALVLTEKIISLSYLNHNHSFETIIDKRLLNKSRGNQLLSSIINVYFFSYKVSSVRL